MRGEVDITRISTQEAQFLTNIYHLYLIDAHKESQKIIEQHGVEGSKKMFMIYGDGIFAKFPKGIEDNTHFSPYGARLMANMVADEMVNQGNPLRLMAVMMEDKKIK